MAGSGARPPGSGLARVEDAALLTGQGEFLDDRDPFGQSLVAAIVRSPHAHARIRGVDAGAALAHPGVTAVITPDDVSELLRPFPLSLRTPMPYLPMGTDRVRFVGEPVAVVVATDRYTAEDAAELVRVDYEPLPVVVDALAATDADAPRLHETADSNVASDRTFSFGAVADAFTEADRIVEADYYFPRYSSTPMECYVVAADWREGPQGPDVTIWSNFHGPFSMVPVLCGALGLSSTQLRLKMPADNGGSFGIKAGIYPYMTLMALASRIAGRPVRWTEDRIEHLLASSAGSDRHMHFRGALDGDGIVRGLEIDFVENVGAYLRPPEPATLYRCFGNLTGPYRIDAVGLRARAVVTNKTPTGLNRGFGGQQLYFGLERLMDRAAGELGIDPLEFRVRNLVAADSFPYATPTGGIYDSGDYPAVLSRLAESSGYADRRAADRAARANGELVGTGIALAVEPSGTNIGYVGLATPAEDRVPGRGKSGSTEHVHLSMDAQGAVTVTLGTLPQGQGHATVARDVVAAELGLPPELVRPVVTMDTATTAWTITTGSYSSRFSPLLTSAVVDAARELGTRLRRIAAHRLDAPVEELELAEGVVRVIGDHSRSVRLRELAGVVHWDPGSLPEGEPALLEVNAAFTPPQAQAASRSDTINSSLCYGFVAEAVSVRIDPETLELSITDVFSVHDPGTVLNEQLLDGQIHGAIVHGLGGALYEELAYTDSGQPSSTFLDYLVPTSAESLFPLTSEHLSTPSPVTRLGAKGAGEGSSMSFPAAVANAVEDALSRLGVPIDSLPLHPSRLNQLITAATGDQPSTSTEWKD